MNTSGEEGEREEGEEGGRKKGEGGGCACTNLSMESW